MVTQLTDQLVYKVIGHCRLLKLAMWALVAIVNLFHFKITNSLKFKFEINHLV